MRQPRQFPSPPGPTSQCPGPPRSGPWTIAWTPPLDGRYALGKESAEKGLAAARERLNSDRAALRRSLRKTFEDWSFAHERLAILRGQLALTADLSDRERRRADAGETSGLAAKRFELTVAELRSELAGAEAEGIVAAAAVRAWRPDLPADAAPGPVTLVPPPQRPDPPESPELRALTLEQEQAAIDVRRTGRFWGFPTVQLGWQTLEDGDAKNGGPIVAAGWTIPIFDRDKAARQEAHTRKEIVRARLDHAKARTAREIEGGMAAYRVLFESAGEAQQALPRAEQIVESVSGAFRAGEAGLTDLLDVFRMATGARLREVEARERASETHRDLEALLGVPLTEGGAR